MPAEQEEGRRRPGCRQRVEDARRRLGVRAVVEGERRDPLTRPRQGEAA
jgi:hypothetical protein